MIDVSIFVLCKERDFERRAKFLEFFWENQEVNIGDDDRSIIYEECGEI